MDKIRAEEARNNLKAGKVKSGTVQDLYEDLEGDDAAKALLRRKNAIDAMNKLRGTGNGNLVSALLRERKTDAAH